MSLAPPPLSDDARESPTSEMTEAVEYAPTPLWIADVLLKGNRMLGASPGGCDTEPQRGWHCAYNKALLRMASPPPQEDPVSARSSQELLRCAIASMGVHRRAIHYKMRMSTDPLTRCSNDLHSFVAEDWLLSVQSCKGGPVAQGLGDPMSLRNKGEQAVACLRALLSDLSTAYMDTEPSERATRAIEALSNESTERLVRNALTTQALVCLFDCSWLAAGARVNHAVFGGDACPLVSDTARAQAGRADAYAAMRLYSGLETIIALMMMGASRKFEGADRDRGRWAKEAMGKAILTYREEMSMALHAYDGTKRRSAVQSGSAYKAQTPGYVAALQEQAATLAMRAHYEDHDEGLHGALICALTEPSMFEVRLPGKEPVRCTFWQAVEQVAEARVDAWTGPADQRVAPLSVAMQQVWASFVFSQSTRDAKEAEPPVAIVGPTPAMVKTMRQAMSRAPPIENFYGRDYAETERKVLARAAKEGRDPQGREAGEAFGYRMEWMGLLSGERAVRPPVAPTMEISARVRGAVTAMAVSETLSVASGGSARALPIASGNAIHYMHTLAAAKEPSQMHIVWTAGSARPRSHSFLLDKGDPKNAGGVLQTDDEIAAMPREQRADALYLQRKHAFVEKVGERTAVPFRAWSGGALATDAYHEFFAEVWRRFNSNLKHPGTQWSDKIARWLKHYEAGTTPPRANGEAKLIHPWRVMYLQQSVARVVLEERWGEAVVLKMQTPNERAAARMHRALLNRLIDVYDYPPWASHLIRRFCSMDEHRAKRRREEEDPTPTSAPDPADPPTPVATCSRAASRAASPSLKRPKARPAWA